MKMYMKNALIATLLLFGVLLAGCDDDDEKVIPEIIPTFNFTIEDEDGTVNFINNSENALSYEWDFGDGSDITEIISPTHVYTASGTYTVTLTAINKESDSKSFSADVKILVAKALSLPIDFDADDVKYVAGDFNGASFEVVDNPDLSGTNTSASKVGAITNIGAPFEGIFFSLGESPIDLTTEKSLTINFWSDKALDVLVKLEEGTAFVETTASHGGTGWEILTFTFNSSASYSVLTMFVDGPGTTAGTFYVDAIEQVPTVDLTGPVITLNGAATMDVTVGSTFTDPGATATDDIDGDVSANITVGGATVDENTIGAYVITYNVSDAAGNAATEVTRTVNVTAGGTACASTDLKLPMDFDCNNVTYSFGVFNGASSAIEDNPFLSGANAVASKVLKITNSGGPFEGGAFNLDVPVDFSTDKTISMKVYSTTALPVLLKFEGGPGGAFTEIVANHGGTGWEQLDFVFTSSDAFTTLVIFVDGPGTTSGDFYVDDIEQVGAVCTDTDLKLPMDFDCAATTYSFGVFNGASSAIEDNPFLSGTNTVASKVLKITNSGGPFEGGAFNLDVAVDFATDKRIKMKVYSTTALPVLLKFEGGPGGAFTEIVANHGGAGWEDLTFDFTSSDAFTTLVLFVDGPGTTSGDFYVDDIEQTSTGGGGGGGGATPGVELTTNGDFEIGNVSGWELFLDAPNEIFVAVASPAQGNFSGNLKNTSLAQAATIKQSNLIAGSVPANTDIEISFDVQGTAAAGGVLFAELFLELSGGGVSNATILGGGPVVLNATSFQTFTYTVNTGSFDASGGITLQFNAATGGAAGSNIDVFIDNVSIKLK